MEKFNTVDFIKKLVSYQSVSADLSKKAQMCECAKFLNDILSDEGFDSEVVKTALHPIVYAKRSSGKENAVRVLCYGHYDVQPVDPIERWHTNPFEAVVKDGKIWGRGSADNKGPFTCLLAGFLNFIKAMPEANLDIAFIFEGEEEIGSPSMGKFLEDNATELSSYDFVLLSDTSSASKEQIVLTTGLRGVASFHVKVKGANTDLHSGMFGGAVYNPIQGLTQVCASLHNEKGFVDVDGFYDDVLKISDFQKEQIAKYPFTDKQMLEYLQIDELYKQEGYSASEAVRVLPTLEFTGIGGGYQGTGNKSVIASECFCKISIRSVPNQNMKNIVDLVKKAIEDRLPSALKVEFSEEEFSDAYYVDVAKILSSEDVKDNKLAKAFKCISKSIEKNFGKAPLYLQEGGSIPLISDVKRLTNLDCVMMGLFTPEDNLHAPNEGFYIEMLNNAVNTYEDFFKSIV